MNLVELEIENYRQFHGLHTFTPGEQAMVAVIGRNGAGKTTLFEAIEWCLYSPNTIRSAEVRSRVGGGHPRAKVTLEDPQSGERFEIEREHRGYITIASIYRASQPDTPIVQGPKQVSDYVARQLLGLSHKAFVATFFTRQKELSFFGEYKATDRRREVGRLLGLETIRIAQESIRDKRLQKQNEAGAKLANYEDQSSSIDFAGQRAQLELKIGECERALSVSESAMQEAALDHESARVAFTLEQSRSQKHHELALEASRLQGIINECAAQITAARGNLREIDQAEAELSRLTPIAVREPEWLGLIEAHDSERQKSEQIQNINRQLGQLDEIKSRNMLFVAEAERIIVGAPAQPPTIAESEPPAYGEPEIIQLLTLARSIDTHAIEKMASDLAECAQHADQARECAAQLQKWAEVAVGLENERDAILAAGDPYEAVSVAETERARLQATASASRASAEGARKVREPLATLRNRLSEGDMGDQCPTCGRPFAVDELAGYLDSLDSQITELDRQIQCYLAAQAAAERDAEVAAERERSARQLAANVQNLETRIADSKPHIDESRDRLQRARALLDSMLAALQREQPPSDLEISAAREQVRESQRVTAQIPRLEQLQIDLQSDQVARSVLAAQLETLGPSRYDAEAHRTDRAGWEQAKHAAAQTLVLQQRVETRPTFTAQVADAEVRSQQTGVQLGQVQACIAELNFQPGDLAAARAAESECLERLNQATGEKHRAESSLASERKDLASLLDWEKRLERVHEEAIEAQREADELSRMYGEFNRFEQFVAQTVTPALADLTSQLVSAVTDGKYDHVHFNEDFGIDVSDGEDSQCFPLSQFSGGERDVVALCARLALSQLVGGQSRNPLQFVVMDEVFGSLDRERRVNLMDTLQKLVDETGVFKQLFVISHVDDVQASPAFDEIWRVAESAEGVSRLEQVNSATMPEDL